MFCFDMVDFENEKNIQQNPDKKHNSENSLFFYGFGHGHWTYYVILLDICFVVRQMAHAVRYVCAFVLFLCGNRHTWSFVLWMFVFIDHVCYCKQNWYHHGLVCSEAILKAVNSFCVVCVQLNPKLIRYFFFSIFLFIFSFLYFVWFMCLSEKSFDMQITLSNVHSKGRSYRNSHMVWWWKKNAICVTVDGLKWDMMMISINFFFDKYIQNVLAVRTAKFTINLMILFFSFHHVLHRNVSAPCHRLQATHRHTHTLPFLNI